MRFGKESEHRIVARPARLVRSVALGMALLSNELGPNLGAQLVHNNLQMRAFGTTESAVNHSKQMKRGVYEQGRKISKPPL